MAQKEETSDFGHKEPFILNKNSQTLTFRYSVPRLVVGVHGEH